MTLNWVPSLISFQFSMQTRFSANETLQKVNTMTCVTDSLLKITYNRAII